MKRNPAWFEKVNKKTKLHFDQKKCRLKAENILKPENVAKHKFFPFLFFQLKAFRYYLLKKYKREGGVFEHKDLFKKRDINYACFSDSYVYAYYNEKLSNIYESKVKELDLKSPIAYRSIKTSSGKGKNNVDFAAEAFSEIKKRKSCYCIAIDVKSFFDTLDHLILKEAMVKLLNFQGNLDEDWFTVYKNLTKFHYIELKKILKILAKNKNDFWQKGKGFDRICSPKEFRELIKKHKQLVQKNKNIDKRQGIPQGTNISGLLANVYMLDFDCELEDFLQCYNGYYRRYSDDILIVVNSLYELKEVINKVDKLLKKYNLEEAEEKRCISYFKNGQIDLYMNSKTPLQYLGFIYDGKNIRVRNATIGKFWRDAKPHIKRMIYSSLKHEQKIPKGKIYGLYSHLKNRKKNMKKRVNSNFTGNFYKYIRTSEEKFRKDYGFTTEVKIKKQMKNSWKLLNNYIDKIVEQYYMEN